MKEIKGKITPLKLSAEVRGELEKRKAESQISFVQSVEDAVLGKDRFNSRIEAEISSYMREHGKSRPDAIEAKRLKALLPLTTKQRRTAKSKCARCSTGRRGNRTSPGTAPRHFGWRNAVRRQPSRQS